MRWELNSRRLRTRRMERGNNIVFQTNQRDRIANPQLGLDTTLHGTGPLLGYRWDFMYNTCPWAFARWVYNISIWISQHPHRHPNQEPCQDSAAALFFFSALPRIEAQSAVSVHPGPTAETLIVFYMDIFVCPNRCGRDDPTTQVGTSMVREWSSSPLVQGWMVGCIGTPRDTSDTTRICLWIFVRTTLHWMIGWYLLCRHIIGTYLDMSSLGEERDYRQANSQQVTRLRCDGYPGTYEVCGSQLNLLPFYTISPFLHLPHWAIIAVIKAIRLISRSPNNVSVTGSWWSADGKVPGCLPTNFVPIPLFISLIFVFSSIWGAADEGY